MTTLSTGATPTNSQITTFVSSCYKTVGKSTVFDPVLAAIAIEDFFYRQVSQPLLFRATAPGEGEWRYWNGRIWSPYHHVDLERDIFTILLGKQITERVFKSVLRALKITIGKRWDEFDRNPIITFDNVVLTVENQKITRRVKPKLDDYSTHYIPIKWESSKIPIWSRLLEEWLPCKDDQKTLQEMFGLCFFPSVQMQVFFVLYGDAATGKSTVTKILAEILGEDRVSAQSCTTLGDSFGLSPLLNRFVNIDNESGFLGARAEANLKAIVGGDKLSINIKGMPYVQEALPCRMIADCNELPRYIDKSEGLWSRLVIIPFTQRVKKQVSSDQIIRSLRPEFGGILNWALKGLTRLLKKDSRRSDSITQSESSTTIKQQHRQASNPVLSWWEACVILENDASMSKTETYQHYKRWCDLNGHRNTLSHPQFAKEVKKLLQKNGVEKVDARPNMDENMDRPRVWNALQLRDWSYN